MNREEILKAGREENRNRDFAELEVMLKAGNIAGKVGATVCCLLSLIASILLETLIFSPWVIYCSITATHWLVRYLGMRKKSDLVTSIALFALTICALVGFIVQLTEVGV